MIKRFPDCFEIPFIGLKHSCDDTASSGYYINDLTGMKLNLFAAMANEEKLKGETLFRSIETNAISDVVNDFIGLLRHEYNFFDIVAETHIDGNWGDVVAANTYGFEIKRCNDKFVGVDIDQIVMHPLTTVNTQIIVEVNGNITQTIDVKLIANTDNYINLEIKGQYQLIRIYVKYCGSDFLDVVDCACGCPCSCDGCATIRPIAVDEDNVISYIKFHPFKMHLTFRCSFDNLICNYKHHLAKAIWIKCGILAMREMMFTSETNELIGNTKEQAALLLAILEGSTEIKNPITGQTKSSGLEFDKNSEYFKALIAPVMSAVSYIRNIKSMCLECNGTNLVTRCMN